MRLLDFIAQCDHDADFNELDATTQSAIRLTAEGIKEKLQDKREGRFGE